MKEQSAPSVPPQGAALSVRQRRLWRAVFFFILLSVPVISTFTMIRLAELIGEKLALFGFWSSIVVAGFACGLIVAKLNSRTRWGLAALTLVHGTAYTLLEFLLTLACGSVFKW